MCKFHSNSWASQEICMNFGTNYGEMISVCSMQQQGFNQVPCGAMTVIKPLLYTVLHRVRFILNNETAAAARVTKKKETPAKTDATARSGLPPPPRRIQVPWTKILLTTCIIT
jgi:hypothetical protein